MACLSPNITYPLRAKLGCLTHSHHLHQTICEFLFVLFEIRFYHWNAASIRTNCCSTKSSSKGKVQKSLQNAQVDGPHHAQRNCYIWTYLHLVSYDIGSIFFKDVAQIPKQFWAPIGHAWLLLTLDLFGFSSLIEPNGSWDQNGTARKNTLRNAIIFVFVYVWSERKKITTLLRCASVNVCTMSVPAQWWLPSHL